MTMDPKQERVLRDGTASEADQPRRTDREAVRAQAERPPVDERPAPRRKTAAVADIRVNLESGTPVEQLARAMGAEPVPELGRSRREKREDDEPSRSQPAPERETNGGPPAGNAQIASSEARQTMKARREHSKGDGNFPAPEPGPQLIDERPEDRTPRDLPKSRDDRTAPKGNATAGQPDRNPNLELSARGRGAPTVKPRGKRKTPAGRPESRAMPAGRRTGNAPDRRKIERTSPKRSTPAARRKGAATTRQRPAQARSGSASARRRRSPQMRAAVKSGSRKPVTKRSLRGGGPRGIAGGTRGGKR
jgi:hypothetical protein